MPPSETTLTPLQKRVLVVMCVVGTAGAGVAFVYKIAEFLFTLHSAEVQGFADVPVTVYFAVAAGWLCLLVWCLLTGKFSDVENSKLNLIAQEEKYERLGQ